MGHLGWKKQHQWSTGTALGFSQLWRQDAHGGTIARSAEMSKTSWKRWRTAERTWFFDFFGPTLDHVTWHLNDLPCLAGLDTKITRLFLGCVKCLVLCFSKTKSRRLLPGSFLLRMHRCRFGQLLESETFCWTNSWDSNCTAGTPSWPPQWTLQLVFSELLELEGLEPERGRASNQHQQICHLDHLEPIGAVWIATKCVVYTFL